MTTFKNPEYYIRPSILRKSKKGLILQYKGELINLKGEVMKQTIKATKGSPAYDITARAASQEDLKDLYENGDERGGIYRHLIGIREGKTKGVKA